VATVERLNMAIAILELLKCGLTMEQIEDGALAGTLALAENGALPIADAAKIAARTIAEFHLDPADTTAIAGLLTNGTAA
jgi:hypothetical protein